MPQTDVDQAVAFTILFVGLGVVFSLGCWVAYLVDKSFNNKKAEDGTKTDL